MKGLEYNISRRVNFCLRVVDALWSCFVVAPLVVFYWSGTWKLSDHYILPDNDSEAPLETSSYVSLGIGIAVGLGGYLILPVLQERFHAEWTLKHVTVSRIFSYIYAFGVLSFWRGVWNITDHLVGTELKWSLVCYGVSKILLFLLSSVSSCLSSPFLMVKDHRDDFYTAYPRCRSNVSETSPSFKEFV